jgi:cytochrome c-type biogenesis protein CcmH
VKRALGFMSVSLSLSKGCVCSSKRDGKAKQPFDKLRDTVALVIGTVALAFSICPPAQADSLMPDATYANVQLKDPAKERAAKALMETIRCLVCQGQSVADSDSDLAGDMRALVRKRIDAGENPEAIRAWLVERYGDWITYDPPLSARSGPLWVAPILFLFLGLFLARGRFARKKS